MQEDWIIVEAPDGTEIEFPSTMSDDDIAGVMRQQYPPNDSAQKFLNVGNQMGMAMPSMDQFTQIRDASVARQQDMARTLDTMGRNVVERRRRHSRDPFRRSTERVDISLDGKDPAPAKNYSELGANELGTSQGLTFRLGDEIKGLIQGEQAGKDQRRLVNYAKRAEPNAFNEGELVGTGFNTLGTLPLAAPRSLQVARALPGGAKTKAFLTGLMSGAGWDTAFQMAGGDGSIADRFADTDKTQTATAAAIGGGAGWLISSIANPLSREASEFADVLDGVLDTRGAVTPDGLRSLERFLRNKGIALDDVTLGRIQTVIQDHAQTGAKSLSLPVRVKDVLVEALDGGSGQIRDAIKNQLRGTMGMGDEGATTIQNAVDEDYAASRQAIQDQYGKRLGQRSRIASEDKTLAELRRIGEEGYEPILERGATSYQGARDLDEVLKGPGINKLKSPLEEIAAGEGLSLEDMIQQNPLRAAHWMQSKARQLAESATDAVKSQAFSAFRRRLLNVIEEAAPGYDKIRKKYGDEFGNLQALEFGDKFLTNAGKAFEIDKMARAFKNLSAAQKRVALLSVRDVLRTATGKGKKAAPPRLGRVGEEQVLESLETVFGARGARVAQDIEDVDEFLRLRTGVDVRGRGSQTTPLAEDIKTATRNVQPTWRRKIGGALENLAGDTALTAMGAGPIQSARAAVGRAGQAIGGNMSGKMNAFAELLEAPIKRGQARVAAQRKTPMKGPDGKFISNEKARELGLLDDEPQNAFNPTPAGKPVQSGIGPMGVPELSGAVLGGAAGSTQGETLEERGRNAFTVAVTGGLLGRGARTYRNQLNNSVQRSVRTTPNQSVLPKRVRLFDRMANEDDVEQALRAISDTDQSSLKMLVGQDDLTTAMEFESRIRENLVSRSLRPDNAIAAWRNKYLRKDIRDQMPPIEPSPQTSPDAPRFDADGQISNAANDASSTQFDNVTDIDSSKGILGNPDEFFTESQKGSAVMAPDYPSNAADDALQRMGTPESRLGPRVDDGIIGLRQAMNEAADQFEQMVASNPGQQSYVFSLPDDPRVGREAVARMLKYRDQMRWGPDKRSNTVLVMSADGGDLALVDRALTNRGGPFATTETTRGAGVNWYRLNDLADLDAIAGSANNAATRGNRGILGNQRGVMMIDGQPRRRQDVLREARQAGDGSFPRAQPQTPPQPPAMVPAQRSGGLRESPLLPLLGIGAAGTGGMVAYDQMNRPEAAAPTGPPSNAFVQGIMRNANTALDDINMRREQGLPKTPGLKPRRTIERTAELSDRRNIEDAIREEKRRNQEYWQWLGEYGEPGDKVLWSKIKKKRASELTVTPQDRRNGIRDKRLPYSYETPVSALETAPIEVLLNGEWISESALEDAR